ncbi:MAG: YfhO family protein [Bryobacteraceae bacterium]|jgi:hypothetical protein
MKRAAAGLLFLVIAVYWRLILPGAVWFDHYDLCQLEIPRLEFLARSIHAGHFPLWDPHVWAGLPVLGSGQPGPVYPLNLLFLTLPFAITTLNWWFIAVHLVAAFGCYALCRGVGLSRIASILGGAAFSCAGYFGSMPWLDTLNGASLAPLIVLFAIRIWSGCRRVQSAALLGLFLGLSWLSGHHEIPLIISYAVLLFTVALWAWRRRLDVRVLVSVAVAFAVAVAISAIQTLPLYEFGRLARRWVGAPEPIGWQDKVPYYVHQQYSLSWKGVLGILVPTPTAEAHTTVFVGVAIVALACLGVACGWRNRPLRYVALLGAGGLLYSLGANTPLHRLAYAVLPMVDKARTPVRGMFLVGLALAVLAACGADVLLERRFSLRFAVPLVIVVGALFAVLRWTAWLTPMYPTVPTHYFAKGVAALAVLAILLFWRAGNRLVRGVVLTLAVLVEASTVAAFRVVPLAGHTVCAASMLDHQDLIAQLRSEVGDGRITVDWNELMFNPGDQYGFDQLQSFVAAVPANILRLPLHTPRVQELMGVTRHLGKNGVESVPGPAMPRAWTETQCAAREPVAVARPDSDDVILTATLGCRGLVVLSDTMYPGWEARVDGRPVDIHEAWGALRSVAVDAGIHKVEMRYRPASVRFGAGLSAVGLLACLALLAWDRRSRSR